MEKNQNEPLNPCEEVLAHHGVLNMKWGVRRYQPYPKDYKGDGKFVGKLSAWGERRQARHKAKTNTRIKNAVETGDKKKLKKYQGEMTPEEYEEKYAETVKNGIDNAVKDRDKGALKKYKEDLNKRDYQHQKDRIDFKEAIDDDNSRKTKKLLSKVDPEDVKEATDLIRSRIALQDQKLNKIRQDSELMAKLDKMNSGLSKVSKTASNIASIGQSFSNVNKTMAEFSKTQKDAEDAKEKKALDKIVKSGDLDKIRANEKRMTNQQLAEAYDRIIQVGSEKEVREAAPFMNNKQVTAAVQKFGKLSDLKASETKPDTGVRVIENFMDTRGTTLFSDVQNSRSVRETSEYLQGMVESNTPIRNLFNRDDEQVQSLFRLSHSDECDDILEHHGILGMHWGIRRYQPYPKGYKGDGKEVGQAKRVGLGDRKYQNYDVSYAKAGSQYRKKTKYTNIDGSLNEKGKLHAQKYISKQIEKNEKYYAKEIAKYEKKAEKYKDSNPELSKKFKDMAKDADRSRKGVNQSIKEMAIDEIMTNESLDNAKVMKAIKTAAGVTVGAATGGAVLAGGLGLSSALSTSENFARAKQQASWELQNAKTQFKLSEPVDSLMRISNTSEIGKRAESAIENTIRTYSDARAYVLGIGLDQAVNRMGWLNAQYGTTDKIAKIAGGTGRTTLNEMGFTPQTISDLNSLVTNSGSVANQILNNPNTANYVSQLTNAGINVPVAQQTLGTKMAIDELVANAPASDTAKSAVTRAYIKSQPNTLTADQQEYYRKHNVG